MTYFESQFLQMCPTIVSEGESSEKTGRERLWEGGTYAHWEEGDLGEVNALQQETLRSAFNHSEAPPPPDTEEDSGRANLSHPLIRA